MTSQPSPPAGATITWLGHSTVVLDVGGVRLITDPLLRRNNGPLRRRGPRPAAAAWADPDLVLLSHLHHDHAELGSLRLLPGVPVLTGPGNAAWLRARQIETATGTTTDDWVGVSRRVSPPAGPAGGTQVRARLVRADHGHRPMPHRPNATNGHLVQARSAQGSLTVWLAGDTSLYDEMAELPVLAGGRLDVAVVPIGGWGPRLSGGHMGPDEAAQACARTGARWALPVHWGTLSVPLVGRFPRGWMDVGAEQFARALHHHAPRCRLLALAPGGSTTIRP